MTNNGVIRTATVMSSRPISFLSSRPEWRDLSVLEAFLVNYYVYILANWNNNVLYIGVTNNLVRRLYEHKNKLINGFSSKYNVNKLVYFEVTTDVYSAISREKQLKCWSRMKKEAIINKMNPFWNDLSYKCV